MPMRALQGRESTKSSTIQLNIPQPDVWHALAVSIRGLHLVFGDDRTSIPHPIITRSTKHLREGERLTASPEAWFQLPELAMGILPGAGGCVSLTRRIGRQRTALMILSGKRLNARQALAWGLVDAVMDEPA